MARHHATFSDQDITNDHKAIIASAIPPNRHFLCADFAAKIMCRAHGSASATTRTHHALPPRRVQEFTSAFGNRLYPQALEELRGGARCTHRVISPYP